MKTFTILLILIMFATSFAQTKKEKNSKTVHTDFSGTWVMDREQNKFASFDWTMIIEHSDPEIKIKDINLYRDIKTTQRFIYYTDGRTSTVSEDKIGEVIQQVYWKGESLIRKGITGPVVYNFKREKLQRTFGVKWTLSKDGNTLTIERRDDYPVYVPNMADGPKDSQFMQTYSAHKFILKRA